jgi:hypothetical protein
MTSPYEGGASAPGLRDLGPAGKCNSELDGKGCGEDGWLSDTGVWASELLK